MDGLRVRMGALKVRSQAERTRAMHQAPDSHVFLSYHPLVSIHCLATIMLQPSYMPAAASLRIATSDDKELSAKMPTAPEQLDRWLSAILLLCRNCHDRGRHCMRRHMVIARLMLEASKPEQHFHTKVSEGPSQTSLFRVHGYETCLRWHVQVVHKNEAALSKGWAIAPLLPAPRETDDAICYV